MPTYDYECTSCKKVMEIFQSMSEEPLKKCPECGGKIKRLVAGGLGVIFKGNGFYVTDSKKKNNESSAQTGKKPVPETAPSEGKSPAPDCSKCSTPVCQAQDKK